MNEELKRRIAAGRDFLKAGDWRGFSEVPTDQRRGVEIPAFQKALPEGAEAIPLPDPAGLELGRTPLAEVIAQRRSRRRFTDESLTLEELSFLLWSTQGLKRVVKGWSFRTVPSAGSRHPFETYLLVERVDGLEKGLYRFLPKPHALISLPAAAGLRRRSVVALVGQDFNPAVTFYWTALPYRTEWRYSVVSHKVIAIDAGHLCQNLYLAAESLGCGTCAIGAYDQAKADELVGADGTDEFVVYAAPVGRLAVGENAD
ncbi:MAG: SagB/ThcOx family dehydrogenase [Candidatus Coatesbacteria bacterium]|nr:SagB/ThcOx family dehydrogenase [Candidatus Coatesbacteria bacterium]